MIFLIPLLKTSSRVDKYEMEDCLSRENCVRHALELRMMHFLLDGVDNLGCGRGVDLRVVCLHFRLWQPFLFIFLH